MIKEHGKQRILLKGSSAKLLQNTTGLKTLSLASITTCYVARTSSNYSLLIILTLTNMKTNPNDLIDLNPDVPGATGLTKREYFSGLAMQGSLADPNKL